MDDNPSLIAHVHTSMSHFISGVPTSFGASSLWPAETATTTNFPRLTLRSLCRANPDKQTEDKLLLQDQPALFRHQLSH